MYLVDEEGMILDAHLVSAQEYDGNHQMGSALGFLSVKNCKS